MEPPFPICTTCGRRFSGAGAHRPRNDASDVIAYFHDAGQCEGVWARTAGETSTALIPLATRADYEAWGTKDLVENSDFVFDLTASEDRGS
jgi:hypothetical protein